MTLVHQYQDDEYVGIVTERDRARFSSIELCDLKRYEEYVDSSGDVKLGVHYGIKQDYAPRIEVELPFVSCDDFFSLAELLREDSDDNSSMSTLSRRIVAIDPKDPEIKKVRTDLSVHVSDLEYSLFNSEVFAKVTAVVNPSPGTISRLVSSGLQRKIIITYDPHNNGDIHGQLVERIRDLSYTGVMEFVRPLEIREKLVYLGMSGYRVNDFQCDSIGWEFNPYNVASVKDINDMYSVGDGYFIDYNRGKYDTTFIFYMDPGYHRYPVSSYKYFLEMDIRGTSEYLGAFYFVSNLEFSQQLTSNFVSFDYCYTDLLFFSNMPHYKEAEFEGVNYMISESETEVFDILTLYTRPSRMLLIRRYADSVGKKVYNPTNYALPDSTMYMSPISSSVKDICSVEFAEAGVEMREFTVPYELVRDDIKVGPNYFARNAVYCNGYSDKIILPSVSDSTVEQNIISVILSSKDKYTAKVKVSVTGLMSRLRRQSWDTVVVSKAKFFYKGCFGRSDPPESLFNKYGGYLTLYQPTPNLLTFFRTAQHCAIQPIEWQSVVEEIGIDGVDLVEM